jgi:predicted SnoaL-like aldol condensation-catalyzing enzyme
MSAENNKAIVKRYFEEVFNKRKLELIDEFFAPNYTNHNSLSRVSGPEGVRRMIEAELRAFPDLQTTVEDIMAEGDKVAIRCTDRFTRASDGAKMILPWIEIVRMENGKAVEGWYESDTTPIRADLSAALGGQ